MHLIWQLAGITVMSTVAALVWIMFDKPKGMHPVCHLLGHGCKSIQSNELCNWIPPDHWCWPGVITFCPRCGMLWKHTTDIEEHEYEIKPPWFAGSEVANAD